MAAQVFQRNTIIFYENTKYQLKREVEDGLWQIENCRTGRFREISLSDMRKLYLDRKLTFRSQSLGRAVKRKKNGHIHLNEEGYELAKQRLAYVKAILDIPTTHDAIRDHIAKIDVSSEMGPPPSASTLIRLKKRYLDSGKDITSLIPKHSAKGNRVSRYAQEIVELVEDVIDEKYMCSVRHTVQDVVDEVKARLKKYNLMKPAKEQLDFPKRNFIESKIRKIPEFDKVAARYGYTAAMHRFRSVKEVPTSEKPLDRVEIDHTQLDLFVIDEEVGAVLGRPWVTVCIDVHTRSVLGIYIGFIEPSYLTVSYCLKHAFLPKLDDASSDIKTKNAWVQHGVMRELVVDNGMEFHSSSLENACYSLGIEIHYSARKTPWFKGKVERFFKELNNNVAHKIPGTSFSNIFDKGDYDPKKHACISSSVLKPLIHKWIVDVYHQRPHLALQASPFEMWSRNISDDQIPIPDDIGFLDATLGKSDIRTLTHKGIEYDRIFYNSDELSALRDELGENFKVDIRVDDSDIGEIVVISPDSGEILKVPALCIGYASGTSRFQHKIIRNYNLKQMRKDASDSWLMSKHEVSELVKKHILGGKKFETKARSAKYQEQTKTKSEVKKSRVVNEASDLAEENAESFCGSDESFDFLDDYDEELSRSSDGFNVTERNRRGVDS